jgi:tetratricopeptide (TPR) repeat protein
MTDDNLTTTRSSTAPIIILVIFFILPTICAALLVLSLAISSKAYQAGSEAYTKGDIDTAISEFTRAIKFNPLDVRAYFMRADIHYALGKYDLALEDYTAAIKKGYKPAGLGYSARGNVYAAMGDYKNENRDSVEAMKTSLDAGEYYQYLAERAQAYSTIIESNPKLASAYFARGYAGAHSPYADDDTAIQDLTTALELGFEPQAPVYVARGLAWMSKEDNDKAMADFERAITLDGDAYDAYYYHSEIHIQDRDYQQAYSDLKKLAQLDPSDADNLNSLCWYGSLLGYARDVLKACNQAVALAPDSPYIHDSRGVARALAGDTSGAIEDFQFLLDSGEGSDEVNAQRKNWIAELKRGGNPFDEETLQALLAEE